MGLSRIMLDSNRGLRYSLRNAALPSLDDTDLLQLYHLRSFPHQLVTSQVGTFNIQTAGLAFRSEREVVVFLYEPQNYSACFLPVVAPNGTLEWDTRAAVNVLTVLDISYWQQSTFLTHVNGVVYANYIHWVSKYLKEHSRFILHSVCSSADELSCFVHSHTWDNFVADSMSALAKLAVHMRAILPPRATKIEIISFVEPVTVVPVISGNNTLRKQIARDSEGFLQFRQVTTDVQDGGVHLRLSRRGINSADPMNRLLYSTARYLFETEELNQANGEIDADVEQDGHEQVADNDFNDGPGNASTDIKTHNDSAALPTAPSTASNYSNITVDVTVTNSTGNKNSSKASEWLIDKPEELVDVTSKLKQNITDLDVTRFYLDLLTCMQVYQLESYSSAFRSCLKEEDVAFVHIKDDHYYQISPRYPFIVDNQYFLSIPEPYKDIEPITSSDTLIGVLLCLFVLAGLYAALARLKIVEWCREKQKKLLNRDRYRGLGDSAGLRVWHQHNWKNSPSPTSSLTDLLGSHYGSKNNSSRSFSGDNDEFTEMAPLLSVSAHGSHQSNQQNAAVDGSREKRVPPLKMPAPLNEALQRGKHSYEVGIVDDASPSANVHQSGLSLGGYNPFSHAVMDSSRGILSRTFRSEDEITSAPYASVINFPRNRLSRSSDSFEEDGSTRGAFVANDEEGEGVIDREAALGMLGLNKNGSSLDSSTQFSARSYNNKVPVKLSRPRLTKSSPLPSTENLTASISTHTRSFSAEDTIDRLIDSSKHVAADNNNVILEDMDVGKSRRRSAAAVETADLL